MPAASRQAEKMATPAEDSLWSEAQDAGREALRELTPPVTLPRTLLVQGAGGDHFKLRIYPDEAAAAAQAGCLSRLPAELVTPRFLGQLGNVLYFAWLEAAPASDDEATFSGIGEYLGRLARLEAPEFTLAALDQEFDEWIGDLKAARLLSPRAAGWLYDAYRRLRPPDVRLCLDYWDAIPQNFGWAGDMLALLDEKHLRPSPEGVGLAKPRLLLPAESFAQMYAGYLKAGRPDVFAEQAQFLELYYMAAALHFYSRMMREGIAHVPSRARLRRYRRWLVARSAPGLLSVLGENLWFIVQHPSAAARFLASKLAFPLRSRRGERAVTAEEASGG